MLFNSSEYMAFFLPLVLLVCVTARRVYGARAAQAWILCASLYFYAWFKPANLFYLCGSIVVNWFVARLIDRTEQPRRKRLLQVGLFLNIAYLCTFKYVNFLLGNFAFVLHRPGFHLPDLQFPLGISFFTLSQIMYLVDTYEGLLPAMGLFDYSTFVSFFPYLISGPIPRAKRIQHQYPDFGGKQAATLQLMTRGFYLFVLGLAKKVLLADVFARVANLGFSTTAHLSMLEAWTFTFAYTLQMYFDFSGYSDMAIGSALMLGIEIPRNFDAPLRSRSITEFWQRWHISLSQFITTYLYTPMLRSMRRRKLFTSGLFTSAVAVFLSMTLAGLWHGPAWTFVVYGVIHGAALACNQFWHKKNMPALPAFLSWLLTITIVNLAMMFFRSTDLYAAGRMTAALLNVRNPIGLASLGPELKGLTLASTMLLPIGVIVAFFGKSSDQMSRDFVPSLTNAFGVTALFVVSCLFMVFNTSQEFLYFQF